MTTEIWHKYRGPGSLMLLAMGNYALVNFPVYKPYELAHGRTGRDQGCG